MTTLANIFARDLWTMDDILSSKELQKIVSSKFVVSDPMVSKTVQAQDAGSTILVPFVVEDLYSEPSIMDDSNTAIVGDTISRIQTKAKVGFYAKAYGYKKIVDMLGSGMKSIDAARALLANYWKKDMENRIFASLVGAVASNIADDASDAVNVQATTGFTYDLVVDTIMKAGENFEDFTGIVVHPVIHAAILKADKNAFTVVSEGEFTRTYYNGLEYFVSELAPVEQDLALNNIYTTILLKAGAFVYAQATIDVPVEVYNDPKSGNGAGQEDVISRNGYLLHLNGYSFDEAGTVVNVSPSIADLSNAANWTRKVSLKNSPFLALKCPAADIV